MSDVNEMIQQLTVYDDFYSRGRPIVPDAVYDALRKQLFDIDSENKYFKKVGAPVKERGVKVKLATPMGSLNQVYDGSDIRKWIKEMDTPSLAVSYKMDGNSIQIIYDQYGNFASGATRGDGEEGLDITRHLRRALEHGRFPARSTPNARIRAEAIIDPEVFKLVINTKGEYSNPRNYIGGQLNRTVATDLFVQHVDFVAFEYDYEGATLKSQVFGKLFDAGWKTPTSYILYTKNLLRLDDEELYEFFASRVKDARENTQFEIDGLVIEVDDLESRGAHGFDGLNPRYAIKFKTNTGAATTTVRAIHYTPSKDGFMKPRVEFDPVELDGANITFATGHNAKFILDNKIGVGATISIVRSGQVIPYIEKVFEGTEAQLPGNEYGSWKWNATGVDIVLDVLPDGSKILGMVDFFSAIDAPLLKEGNITQLYEYGYTTISSIIHLPQDALVSVLGENGNTIYIGLRDKLSDIDEWKLAGSLPIFGRGVGRTKMKKVAEAFGSIYTLTSQDRSRLLALDGFQEATVDKIIDGLNDYRDFIDKTNGLIGIKVYAKIEGDLNGAVVVFTGVRDKNLETSIIERGGKIGNGFTKETTHLVAKDPKGNSGKLEKARKSGIEPISLEDARALFG